MQQPSITILGTGGPRPDVSRGATSLLIEAGDDAILIDAGRGVVRQLATLDIPLSRIDPVLITHHHYDHIGELHDVILSSWLTGRTRPLRLFGPPERAASSIRCCIRSTTRISLARTEIATPHTQRLAEYTLACADTVGRIAAEAKVGTLVLTHHRQKSDELLEQMRQDVAKDFSGRVLLGQDRLRVTLRS